MGSFINYSRNNGAGKLCQRLLFFVLLLSLAATALNPTPVYAAQPARRFAAVAQALWGQVESQGAVRVIVKLRADYPPEPSLGADRAASQQAAIRQVQARVLAQVQGLTRGQARRFTHLPYLALTVDARGLERLRQSAEVVSISEDVLSRPSLLESTALIGATPALLGEYAGAGQTIAILDTGVDKQHPFLAGKVVSEACFSTTDAERGSTSLCPGGVEQSLDEGSGANCSGAGCAHGTHVSGIAAGKAEGVMTASGVAPEANIIAIQVFSSFTGTAVCGSTSPCLASYASDQAMALERVYELSGTYAIAAANLSFSSLDNTTYNSSCDQVVPAIRDAVDLLRGVGTATVVAAGNDSGKTGVTTGLAQPACVSGVISVGSTKDGGADALPVNQVSTFSNTHGMLKLMAPGEAIVSSMPGGAYASLSGTSMAAAHVAGAWAVLKSKAPNAVVDQVLTSLQNTSVTVTRGTTNFKRIQVDAALAGLKNNLPLITAFSPYTGTAGTTVHIYGANLDLVTAVSFNNVNAPVFSKLSPTHITAVVPTATSGAIRVTAPGGFATSPTNFTIAAPDFSLTKVSSGLPALDEAEAAAGDYDNDGDLDVLLSGLSGGVPYAGLFGNDGSGQFEDTQLEFPGIFNGSLAWGDYDNDGDLDALMTGEDYSGPATQLLRNEGEAGFATVSTGMAGLTESAAAWGDYDNDGDLDVLLAGLNGETAYTYVYRNDGGGVFVSVSTGLPGVYRGTVDWVDYDRDDDLDVYLTGLSGPTPLAKSMYKNTGGSFTWVSTFISPAYFNTDTAWGDVDHDGYLDLAIMGRNTGNQYYTRVFRNLGTGVSTEISTQIPGLQAGSLALGDLDNDGKLELVASGQWTVVSNGVTIQMPLSVAYSFNGTNFIAANLPLENVWHGSVLFGDFISDPALTLDLLLVGSGPQQASAALYQNAPSRANTFPPAPTGLVASVVANKVTLSWVASLDNQTPQNGLSYNLIVGQAENPQGIVAGMSDLSTGYRHIPAVGNSGPGLSSVLYLLPGQYTWRVQAVDSAFSASPFTAANVFTVYPQISLSAGTYAAKEDDDTVLITVELDEPGPKTLTVKYRTENGTAGAGSDYVAAAGTLTFPAGSTTQTFSIDLLEDLLIEADETIQVTLFDPLEGELSGTNPVTAEVTVRDNDGFEDAEMRFDGSPNDSYAWGDYDHDGDLDLAHTGTLNGTAFLTRILNNNKGILTPSSVSNLQGVTDSTLEWGDFDSDGDLDLLLVGKAGTNYYTKLYRNNLGGTGSAFSEVVLSTLDPSNYTGNWARGAWGDYDGDGDLDLLLTFYTSASPAGARTRLFRNNTNGGSVVTFTMVAPTGLANLYKGAIAWGDYDNDGDLDVVLTGIDSTGASRAVLYRAGGSGTFVDSGAVLQGVNYGGAAWGDYDNDGDLDLAISGCTDTGSPCGGYSTKLYRNDADQFVDANAGLPGAGEGRDLSWGDNDNDGDLDLLISGVNGGIATRLFRNEDGAFVDIDAFTLAGTYRGPNAWGDYDNDGDLDLILSEVVGLKANARIFRNRQIFHNTPPTAPTGLDAKVVGSRVDLKWSAPTDGQTPPAGLTYALRIGNTPGSVNVLAPNAGLDTGTRFVTGSGSAQLSTAALLSLPLDNTYYWSVQAVDTGYSGSPFSAEGFFFTTSAKMEFNESMFSAGEEQSEAVITVTLSKAIENSISVDYKTEDLPGEPRALAGVDYTAVSGTLTFEPGDTTQTFAVPILSDDLDEINEPLRLILSNPSNGDLDNLYIASLTLIDEDATPSVFITEPDPSVEEAGTSRTLTVSLSAVSGQTVTVDYATSDGAGPAAAVAPGDYTPTSGTLTFAPGILTQTLTIPVKEDVQDEYDETLAITLLNPTNAVLPEQPVTLLTILDNDPLPLVQFGGASFDADETQGQGAVMVTLNRSSGKTIKVNYEITGSSATAVEDFTAETGELVFAPNKTSEVIFVTLHDDALPETDETIQLQLTGADEAVLGTVNTATMVIFDDDTPPSASFSAEFYNVSENAGSASITVRLNRASQDPVSIHYQTGDGTARSGVDYEASSGTLEFAAGDMEKTFTIAINNNEIDNEDLTVLLSLDTPVNAALGSIYEALLIIEDDDVQFWIYLPMLRK